MTDIKSNSKTQASLIDVQNIWKDLSDKVSNTPNDLILHSQRTLFCVDNELPEQACAALQDLFVTLKGSGKDLRFRLFNLISPIIDSNDRAYFQQCLANSQNHQPDNPQFEGSVLTDLSKMVNV